MSELVGKVTAECYQELVQIGRKLAKSLSTSQFLLGDVALEIEPMGPAGGSRPHDAAGVTAALEVFAEDIGVPLRTVETYRWSVRAGRLRAGYPG